MLIHPDDITGHHIHKLGPKGCESGPNFPSSRVGKMSRLAQREPGSGKLRLNSNESSEFIWIGDEQTDHLRFSA